MHTAPTYLPAPTRDFDRESAYLRGDGPLAGIALEAVLAENPHHRMAGMLDTALQSGVRPDEIRELLSGIPSAVTV